MTDEELIAALREEDAYNERFYEPDPLHKQSADRIEALVKERDAYAGMERIATEALWKAEARADRLEAKLMLAVGFIEDLKGHEWPLDVQAERILAEIKGVKPRRYMGQIMAECDCQREAECLAAEQCAALKGDDQ